MSAIWSLFIVLLVLITIGVSFFLLCWAPRVRIPTHADGTTHHVWAHGVLREGVQKLPRWWLLASFSAFAFAIGYLVLFPGLGSFAGVLGWSSSGELEQAEGREADRQAALLERARTAPMSGLVVDREVQRAGRRLFVDNCAACHGMEARGIQALGAPNLVDGDWLYGGDEKTVMASILDGRNGMMPPMAQALSAAEVTNLAHYVISLSRPPSDPVKAELGRPAFGVCAACHGAGGKGNPLLGAPNLSDDVWLYGGAVGDIQRAITEGRGGVMPAWRDRLGNENARLILAWLFANGSTKGATP